MMKFSRVLGQKGLIGIPGARTYLGADPSGRVRSVYIGHNDIWMSVSYGNGQAHLYVPSLNSAVRNDFTVHSPLKGGSA